MRLFTGIALAPAVIERLNELLAPLRSKMRLQWSPPENFHITTKFLGEWPREKLPEVLEALKTVPKPGPFAVDVERLGFFPNEYSPRVLWAGVRASQGLALLARNTDAALSAVGVPPERRAYSPHLTLARIKPDSPIQAIRELLAKSAEAQFGTTETKEFYLYESRPSAGGSIYEKLATFPL